MWPSAFGHVTEVPSSCGNNYIDETIRNVITRIDEHEQRNGISEPSKHLKNNSGHQFNWKILSRAPSHRLKRKILQSYFKKQLNPSLNDQLDSKILTLFRQHLFYFDCNITFFKIIFYL